MKYSIQFMIECYLDRKFLKKLKFMKSILSKLENFKSYLKSILQFIYIFKLIKVNFELRS